jgi:serralysin
VTAYFVNSFIEQPSGDAFDLSGAGDTLLVTSAGSLVTLSAGDGIDSTGNSEQITLDGLAYSAGNFGAFVGGTYTNLVVNGEAQSGTSSGVAVYGSSNSVNVGAQGEVSGSIGAVLKDTDGALTNDGHITGSVAGLGLYQSSGDQVTNDGVISASQTLTFGGAILIDGATDETVTNAGLISGPTALYEEQRSTATIYNSGTIEGNLALADTSMLDIENAGVVQATSLDFLSSANNVLTNSGRIHAQIDMGAGTDQIYNTGTIAGQIDFAGSSDTLINDGTIHGSVTMGVNDLVINTGTIRGPVYLGAGDTLNANNGSIVGSIEAANKDTFDFGGSFGHNTIADFLGSSSLHDTIHFASDDFASYAAVQSHMAQVGANVVITLDAADTIILQHITLAHLFAADFTFG